MVLNDMKDGRHMKHEQQVYSFEDLARLVQDLGFFPFFKNSIPGFSVEEHTPSELWFSQDDDGPWEWKGPVIQETGCAYGKLFQGKAGFISSEWFPDFANYRRGGYDFDTRYEYGLVRHQDRLVHDVLAEYDSLLSTDLKRLCDFGKGGRKGFDGIMERLQMQGYAVISDFEYRLDRHGNSYGWGVARYAIPEHYFGESFTEQVYSQTVEESRQRIVGYLRELLPDASEREILKIVG